MKRILFSLLFLLISFIGYGQFINTTTTANPTTLFKSRGGIGADSAFILLNNYADTTAANFSVASKYSGSFIRVDTSIYYRTLNPNKWNLFAKVGSTGTIVSISQGFGIVNTPNPITTTGTVTVDTLAMSTKANVQKVKDSVIGVLGSYVQLQQSPQVAQAGGLYVNDTARANVLRANSHLRSDSIQTGGLLRVSSGLTTPNNTGYSIRATTGVSINMVGVSSLDTGYLGSNAVSVTLRATDQIRFSNNTTGARQEMPSNRSGIVALQGDTTGFGTKFIYNQIGSNLSAQTAKFWVSDTARAGRVYSEGTITSQNGLNYTQLSNTFLVATNSNRSTLVDSIGIYFTPQNNGIYGLIKPPSSYGANREYTLPNASGTIALTSNVTDSSAALRAAINTKLNISDAAATYATIGRLTDTASALRSSINTKLNISDFNTTGDARYLQLTGGTLTGALSGTSATFSGNTNTGSLIFTPITANPSSTAPALYSPATGILGINANGGERARVTSTGLLIQTTTDNGTDALQVDGSGLFTGNILTSTGYLQTANGRGVTIRNAANSAYRTALSLNSSDQIIVGADTDITGVILGTASAPAALSIASTGAATFSSTVKSIAYIINTGSGDEFQLGRDAGGAAAGFYIYNNTDGRYDLKLSESDGSIYSTPSYAATVGGTNRDLFVDNTGLIGYVPSIRASKKNIAIMGNTSWLHSLKPSTFNYRVKDSTGKYTDSVYKELEYGLIAEDVEKVNPEMVFYDVDSTGKHLRGVSYSKLIIPMLKEIQEQKKTITALEARIAKLEALITGAVAQAQDTTLHKTRTTKQK